MPIASKQTRRSEQESWSDEQLIEAVLAGEATLFEVLMRRYSQRLYRVAYSILRQEADAEDAMQEAYLRAFQFLRQFEGRAKFSTWLTRIAVHEALGRAQRRERFVSLDFEQPLATASSPHTRPTRSPEQLASNSELGTMLQAAIATLPSHYRAVLELRDMHDASTEEAAGQLKISQENVKIRLHRARALVRKKIIARVPSSVLERAIARV
jgi:RNA polymerase sigma-70 factor (ECF subfamily)